MRRFVGRENVRKRLAAFEGEQGRTIYAGGAARIELPDETVVVPPGHDEASGRRNRRTRRSSLRRHPR